MMLGSTGVFEVKSLSLSSQCMQRRTCGQPYQERAARSKEAPPDKVITKSIFKLYQLRHRHACPEELLSKQTEQNDRTEQIMNQIQNQKE
jgi:hypothetical protein